MKVNKIDHMCIAVRDIEEARKVWEPVLGKTKPDDAYENQKKRFEWSVTGLAKWALS